MTIAKTIPGLRGRKFSFVRVPTALLENVRYTLLSPSSKLLYALLLDRAGLSTANGWTDKNGNIYVMYSNKAICEILNCGHEKASKMLRELEAAQLIRREKQGRGYSDRIYVLPFKEVCGKSASRTPENQTSRTPEISAQELGKSAPNHIESNHTENNYTNPSIKEIDAMRLKIRENIDYDILCERLGSKEIDEIVTLMADVVCGDSQQIKIGGIGMSGDLVRRRFMELRFEHIEYVLDSLHEQPRDVKNIRGYLLAALFNAPTTIDNYYRLKVEHDWPTLK